MTNLFDGKIFSYPKPSSLIRFLAKIINSGDALILDFFSGSATTAHAVMKLNAEDGGNRKFIMVQLPEKTDEKSEAYKAGYKNICEIGKERIRRAGAQILNSELGILKRSLDTGFRVLKLDSSNMEDVHYTPQEFELQSLFMENVKADRTGEDLQFQVMLDLGVVLSIGSALAYALFIVIINRSRTISTISNSLLTFYTLCVGAVVFLSRIGLSGTDILAGITTRLDWLNLVGLALLPTIVSTATLAVATRNIGATKASVLGVFEPITAILVGTLVFGEALTDNIIVGITIAMLAVTFMIISTKR